MKFRTAMFAILAMLNLGVPVAAQSGGSLSPEEQVRVSALKECFARKSTGEDRITLAKWFVAIMANSPSVQGVAKLNPGVKDQLDTGVAQIFTRLLTVDCADEARVLWKTRSSAAFRAAGETLGRLAMQEVMSGDGEGQMFSGYVSHINPADFKKLEQ